MRRRPRRTRTLNELNERLKVGIRTFGSNRSYTSKRTAPCFFRVRQGAVLCCLAEMRTMKRLSFNSTHRIQSKSSSPIALIMPKRSDHSRTHFHRTCVVGLFRAHCHMRTFATHAQSGYRSACLTSFSASIPAAPPINPSTASPNGPTRPKPCPDSAKMAEICGCERS